MDEPDKYGNINGHGPKNLFIPIEPTTLISAIRRDDYVLWSYNEIWFSFWNFIKAYFIDYTYNDGTWYENAVAVGTQLYPSGLYMYYDMFSMDGVGKFAYDWVYVMFFYLICPYFLNIPVNDWILLANTYQGYF